MTLFSKLSILFTLLLLTACSTVKMVYPRLDWIIPHYIDDYISLNDKQELQLDKELRVVLDWHCTTPVNQYATWLGRIRFDVEHGGTIDGRRGKKAGFTIQGDINRFDYNLKFDRAMPGGDLVVGKSVSIVCNVEINEVVPKEVEEEKK